MFGFGFLKQTEDKVSQTAHSLAPSQLFDRFKLKAGLFEGDLDGVVKVSILRAEGLLEKNKKILGLGGGSDPYVEVLLDDQQKVQTTVKKGVKVVWKEYFEFEVKGKHEILTLRVIDKDWHGTDYLGEVRLSVKKLSHDRILKGPSSLETKLVKSGEKSGTEDFKVAGTLDYTVEYRPKSLDGHMKIHIDKATGVKSTDGFFGAKGDPYCCILLDSELLAKTSVQKKTDAPVWNQNFDLNVAGDYQSLYLSLWDEDFTKDDYISHLEIPTKELVEKKKISGNFPLFQQESKEKKAVPMGELTFTVEWLPPKFLGKVDVKLAKATDLPNSDTGLLGDVSDPYVEVHLDGAPVAKTKVINNSLNPEWNETLNFEAKGAHQSLELVVVDKDLVTDDPLGCLRLPIADIVKNKKLQGEFVLGPYKASKGGGTLSFDLTYHPK
jgi:Ca2+-dependent lipid-binding protein